MASDRLERLVAQVLEETRAFRQETSAKIDGVRREIGDLRQEMNERFAAVDEKFAAVDEKVAAVHRDLRLVQTAVLETARDVKRVDTKIDAVIADHGARIAKLEGAAE